MPVLPGLARFFRRALPESPSQESWPDSSVMKGTTIGKPAAQFVGQGGMTLQRRVLGQTETTRQRKRAWSSHQEWVRQESIGESVFMSIFEAVRSPEEIEALECLVQWARDRGLEDRSKFGDRHLSICNQSFFPKPCLSPIPCPKPRRTIPKKANVKSEIANSSKFPNSSRVES